MNDLGYYDFLQNETLIIYFSQSGIYYQCISTEQVVEISNGHLPRESERNLLSLKEITDSSFMELNTIYLENANSKTKDIKLVKVKESLKKILSEYENCNYSIIIPTDWDFGIREDLIRPIFIEAGLLNKNDHKSRLLFFTNLESNFSFIQSPTFNTETYPIFKQMLLNGKRYIMCGVEFKKENKISVNLDLFSAHYPSITSSDKCYVSRLLKAVSFDIPFDSNMENDLVSYLKTQEDGWNSYSAEKILVKMKGTYSYQNRDLKDTDSDEDGDYIYPYNKDSYDDTNAYHVVNVDNNFNDDVDEELDKEDIRYLNSLPLNDEFFKDCYDFFKQDLSYYLDILLKDRINNKNISFIGTFNLKSITNYTENQTSIKIFLRSWVNQYMKRYCEKRFNYKCSKAHGPLNYVIENAYRGAINLIGRTIINSVFQRLPSVTPRNEIKDDIFTQVQMFVDSKPSHVINIVMSFNTVYFSCAYTGATRYAQTSTGFSKCDIEPLDSFFVHSNIHQSPILQITKGMKQYMETNFKKYMKLYPKYKRDIINSNKRENIKKQFSKREEIQKAINTIKKTEWYGFFTKKKEDDYEIVQVRESKYIDLFLMMYLLFIDELIIAQLHDILGTDKSKNKVGYVISVEKMLMDNVFFSKKCLQILLFNNGMFHEENENRKLRIVTHGEGILPIIQQQTKVNFKLKSYFILAQLHETYIRLTLNQVVRTSSPEENNTASIIIQDKTIEIENVNDTLCKHLWSHIKANNEVNYCDLHEEERFNLYSLHKQKFFLKKLKIWLSKSFSFWDKSLNMDDMNMISFNSTCDCSINISLRTIVDKGLNLVLQNITTIIAGVVSNKDIFGYYTVDSIFVMGNIFDLKQNILTNYINNLQWKLEESLDLKEKDCNIFVLKEELFRLLQPVMRTRPYIYDSFVNGFPCQVSKDTFIIYTKGSIGLKNVGDRSDPTVLIRKGDLIPDTGLVFLYELDFSNARSEICYICLERLGNSKGHNFIFKTREIQKYVNPQIAKFEIIYKSHEHVLQFSVILDETYYKGFKQTQAHIYTVLQELSISYV